MLARQDRRKDKQNIARVRVLCFLCLFVKYLKGLKSPKSPYVSKVLKWRSLSTKGRYRAARAANKHRKIKLLSQYSGLLEGWVLQLNQFKRMLWVHCVYLLVQHLSHQANELHNQLYTNGFFFQQIQVIADALSWRPDIWSLYSGYFCCTWKEVGWREKHWLKHIFQEPSIADGTCWGVSSVKASKEKRESREMLGDARHERIIHLWLLQTTANAHWKAIFWATWDWIERKEKHKINEFVVENIPSGQNCCPCFRIVGKTETRPNCSN